MAAVQIYSMTSVVDAVATADAGAELIGLVIAEPGVVAEAIDADLARKILSAVRPRSRGVALSLSDDRDEICAMVDAVRPDVLHVVAREIEPEDCAWIRERIAPVMLLRAIAVRAGETLTEADAHQDCLDYLMLDSGAKGPPYAGATGETHDWSISRTVVERSRVPVILAGDSPPRTSPTRSPRSSHGASIRSRTPTSPGFAEKKIRRACTISSTPPAAHSRKI